LIHADQAHPLLKRAFHILFEVERSDARPTMDIEKCGRIAWPAVVNPKPPAVDGQKSARMTGLGQSRRREGGYNHDAGHCLDHLSTFHIQRSFAATSQNTTDRMVSDATPAETATVVGSAFPYEKGNQEGRDVLN
jgi:hypothetical protein